MGAPLSDVIVVGGGQSSFHPLCFIIYCLSNLSFNNFYILSLFSWYKFKSHKIYGFFYQDGVIINHNNFPLFALFLPRGIVLETPLAPLIYYGKSLFYFKFFSNFIFKNKLLLEYLKLYKPREWKKFRYSFNIFWRDLLC